MVMDTDGRSGEALAEALSQTAMEVRYTPVSDLTDNLARLIDVIKVENLTDVETVKRELVLIRMSLTADNKNELIRRINQLNCKILTFNSDHCVLEFRGSKAEVDKVLETLKPLGIDDIARTGIAALERKN